MNHQEKVVVAEFKISLYCDGCEKLVADTISKIEGVEKFMTDMTRHQVMVIGKIDPDKVLKKLKKTGKRVEMILPSEDDIPLDQGNIEQEEFGQPAPDPVMYEYLEESSLYTIFSDENPNACLIM
ncbi:unnamed protein product [Lactuca saligna]|uniref:HMA domain-containing protein n=1 Tax=Lactuca saligna TaxID=75948 RepID=A0AA36EAH9_LACSI|nr:unnamed protein product [Lactuca saligna]